jgi:putative transposase
MPRIARGSVGGVCCHVINRGNARQTVFHNRQDYAGFLELIGLACQRAAVRVVGCCLMPNHLHLVLWPTEDGDLSRWMQWLMTSHVRRHHRRYGSSGHVWQGRFKSFPIQLRRPSAAERAGGVLQHADPVLDVLRYVERNPLRAALVNAAQEWQWSSLYWWVNPTAAPPWWQRDALWRPDDWMERVNKPQNQEELAALSTCLQRGRPYGSETWVSRAVSNWNLESTVRPRGRPRKHQK